MVSRFRNSTPMAYFIDLVPALGYRMPEQCLDFPFYLHWGFSCPSALQAGFLGIALTSSSRSIPTELFLCRSTVSPHPGEESHGADCPARGSLVASSRSPAVHRVKAAERRGSAELSGATEFVWVAVRTSKDAEETWRSSRLSWD